MNSVNHPYFTSKPCIPHEVDSVSSLPDFSAIFHEEQRQFVEKMDEEDSMSWLEEVHAREQLHSCENDEIRFALESRLSDISQQRIIIGTRLEKLLLCDD